MQVGEIMHGDVRSVSAEDTFARAAAVLRENRISSVMVQKDGCPAGIITERDVVSLVADGEDPSSTVVGTRMTRGLTTVEPTADITDAARIMAERGIRHLPVVERNEVVGMVSIRDLLTWAAKQSGPDLWIDLVEAAVVEWPH